MHPYSWALERIQYFCSPAIAGEDFDVLAFARELSNCSVSDCIQALSEQLKSDCPARRSIAAYYLCELYPDSVDATSRGHAYFKQCLASADDDIIFSALSMMPQLSRLPGEYTELILGLAGNKDNRVNCLAAVCLALSESPIQEAFTLMRQWLSSPYPDFVLLSATVLIRRGLFLDEAIPKLLSVANKPPVTTNALIGAFYHAQDKTGCAAELRRLFAGLTPSSREANLTLTLVARMDGSSQATLDLLCQQLETDNHAVATAIRESFLGAGYEVSPRIVELLVQKLSSPDLLTREATADCLEALPISLLAPHASTIILRLVDERDVLVLENIARICKKLGSLASEPLLSVLPQLRHTRHWIALTTFAEVAHDNRKEMMKVIAKRNLAPEESRIWSTFLGTYRVMDDTAVEMMAELLESDDALLVQDTLVALRKGGKGADVLSPRLIAIATGDNPRMASLATEALEGIGSTVFQYFNDPGVTRCDASRLSGLRARLEARLDETDVATFDLNWIGSLSDIQAFVAIGRMFREFGPVSQRRLQEIVNEQKSAGLVDPAIPDKASTIRDLIARLENAASTRYGREMAFFDGASTQRRTLSNDGKAFLKKCEKYLKSLSE